MRLLLTGFAWTYEAAYQAGTSAAQWRDERTGAATSSDYDHLDWLVAAPYAYTYDDGGDPPLPRTTGVGLAVGSITAVVATVVCGGLGSG